MTARPLDTVRYRSAIAPRESFHSLEEGVACLEPGQVAAAGRQLRLAGMVISRIADGRIAEEWEIYDGAGMARQLGQQ
jgi:predicted ester cyclase